MALLGVLNSAAGNKLQYGIDYRSWLQRGEVLTSVTFVVDTPPATITNVSYSPDETECRFFVNGGTAGVNYNILATATTNFGEQRTDTIAVNVAAAGS
jgi:hypothetical protein